MAVNTGLAQLRRLRHEYDKDDDDDD